MRYDFSRDTFQPSKQYSRVLMRQGAVLLDADWNEQQAILLDYMRTLARDVFGRHAGPAANPGFEITQNGDQFVVGQGRYYVDGILVESHSSVTLLPSDIRGFGSDSTKHSMLLVLEVWERAITYVQDDAIRDTALGGIETCGRAQVGWRVVAISEPPPGPAGETPKFDCDFADTLPNVSLGTLQARAAPPAASSGPCVISPDARYRGPENQLYRVEIHQDGTATGDASGATYKFSRENGSVIFPVSSLPGLTDKDVVVTLETLWRDRRFGLEAGDWVELCNNRTEMGGLVGPLLQVKEACGDTLQVTLTPSRINAAMGTTYDMIARDGHIGKPFLRRWDHKGDPAFGGACAAGMPVSRDGWLDVEDGIQIRFAKDVTYRAGDYWLIPARVATGGIEWPLENAVGDTMIAQALPPHGPRYHYAPLSFIQIDGNSRSMTDCRCRIERLPCVVAQPPPAPGPIRDSVRTSRTRRSPVSPT